MSGGGKGSEAEAEEEKGEAEYHSKDFDWENLRADVENHPSFAHHFLPFHIQSSSSSSSSSNSQQPDSDAWKRFHIRRSPGKFFKGRRYLLKEFPELVPCKEESCKLLEVGCGNGSTVLPVLRGNENVVVYACDCSSETLVRAKGIVDASKVLACERRFCPFYCDLPVTGFPSWLACNRC